MWLFLLLVRVLYLSFSDSAAASGFLLPMGMATRILEHKSDLEYLSYGDFKWLNSLVGDFCQFAAHQIQVGVDRLLVVLVDLGQGKQRDKGCTNIEDNQFCFRFA